MTRRGFTMVELIASLAILSLLGTLSSVLILEAADGYVDAASSAQAHTDLSIAMDRIVREVRAIDLDPDAGGVAPDIDEVDAALLEWRDESDTVSRLELAGTELRLSIEDGAARTLLDGVTAFEIVGRDDDHAILALPLQGAECDVVRRIGFTITIQRNGTTQSLRALVFLRAAMAGGA